MTSLRRMLAATAAASLVLGACTADDGTDDGTGAAGGDATEATGADALDAGEADGDDRDASDDGSGGGEEPDGPTSIDLDETAEHENGSTMTVTGLELDDNGIFVSFEAYNGYSQPIQLALYGEDPDVVEGFVQLIDDTGRGYTFQGPDDNPSLELEPNSDMSARIGFLGRTPADATSVTLRFNYNAAFDRPVDGPSVAPNSPTPTFVFEDLPLPGR